VSLRARRLLLDGVEGLDEGERLVFDVAEWPHTGAVGTPVRTARALLVVAGVAKNAFAALTIEAIALAVAAVPPAVIAGPAEVLVATVEPTVVVPLAADVPVAAVDETA
jgi:hypothetical protein